jgi:hypothetical protein
VELAAKLQLKPGMSIALLDAPADPPRIGREPADPKRADALLVFARDRAALEQVAERLVVAARRDVVTWIANPKAGQLGTDLNRDVVREALEARGARTVRQIAIDDVWSALRLRAR